MTTGTNRQSQELIQYQLAELKLITEQGFERIEKKAEATEARIIALEMWRAAGGGRDQRRSDGAGISVPVKAFLAVTGVLAAIVAVLEAIVQAKK